EEEHDVRGKRTAVWQSRAPRSELGGRVQEDRDEQPGEGQENHLPGVPGDEGRHGRERDEPDDGQDPAYERAHASAGRRHGCPLGSWRHTYPRGLRGHAGTIDGPRSEPLLVRRPGAYLSDRNSRTRLSTRSVATSS